MGCTFRGTNLVASAASSNSDGQRGSVRSRIPTWWISAGRRHPFRPLHFLQHVTVLSLFRFFHAIGDENSLVSARRPGTHASVFDCAHATNGARA